MYTANNKSIGEIPGFSNVPGIDGLGQDDAPACGDINNVWDAKQAVDSGQCMLSQLNPDVAEYLVQLYPEYAPKAAATTTTQPSGTYARIREEIAEYEAIASPAQAAKYVKILQDQLTKLGYKPGAIDGKYGTNTKSALKAAVPEAYKTSFASSNALQAIGFGPRTAAAIRDSVQYQYQYGYGPSSPTPTPTPTPTGTTPQYPLAPTAAAAMLPKKSYWWLWLLLGVAGVAAAGGIAYYVAKKKTEGEMPYPEEEGGVEPEHAAPAEPEPLSAEGFEPAGEEDEEF